MIPNHFYIFTIFKCDYNVGITIWRCLSNYCIRYLCTYIKSHLDVFQNYIQSASAGILHNYTVSANPWNLWKLSDDRKPPHQEIRRNSGKWCSGSSVFYYLLTTFIQLRFKFFKKIYFIYSLEILLSSQIAKNTIILKFPPPHVLIYDPRHLFAVIWVVEYVVCRY